MKIATLLVVAGVLAVGCSKSESKATADSTTEAKAKPDAKKDEAKPAAHDPGKGAPSTAGIPEIPETQSSPPTVAEWEAAPHVNNVGANAAAKDCTMKIVREWLKVNCTGKIEDVTNMEGFGKQGFDYFESVKPGSVADFVVRIKKGNALKLRINRDKDRASLFVNWPSASPKPTIIALQENAKT